MFLLPSLFTVANLFCGYASVIHATRSDFDTAAVLIGVAMLFFSISTGLLVGLLLTAALLGPDAWKRESAML